MSKFKDSEGREWIVKIDVNALKRVQAECDIDLLGITKGDASPVAKIVTDPMLLIPTLYAVCKLQAEKLGVSVEDFGGALTGDVIDTGTTALIEGIADFFPASRRKVLRAALAKVQEADAMVTQNAATAIANLDVNSLLSKSGESSGSLPASVESTPDPARSAN